MIYFGKNFFKEKNLALPRILQASQTLETSQIQNFNIENSLKPAHLISERAQSIQSKSERLSFEPYKTFESSSLPPPNNTALRFPRINGDDSNVPSFDSPEYLAFFKPISQPPFMGVETNENSFSSALGGFSSTETERGNSHFEQEKFWKMTMISNTSELNLSYGALVGGCSLLILTHFKSQRYVSLPKPQNAQE